MNIIKYVKGSQVPDVLVTSPVVNVEKDSDDCFTIYLEDKDGVTWYITLSADEIKRIQSPHDVS